MTHPFPRSETGTIFQRYRWPVSWISLPQAGAPPYVLGFRLVVELSAATTIRAHVTADERYELYLDGQFIARGPERSSPEAWFYQSVDLPVPAGRHVLFARVWSLGSCAPCAQMSVRPGFLLGVENPADGTADARWSTGLAPWEVRLLDGYHWIDQPLDMFAGKKMEIDGRRYRSKTEWDQGEGWTRAIVNSAAFTAHPTDLTPARLLRPGTLPPMLRQALAAGEFRFVEDVSAVTDVSLHPIDLRNDLPDLRQQLNALLQGRTRVAIPAGRKIRAIVDLKNYFCAYPDLEVSQGRDARLSIAWAEALFDLAGRKGNRQVIEGRCFKGLADTFRFDGRPHRHYTTLWWQAGRYVQLSIETGAEELVLEKLAWEETRYPLEMESTFAASDPRFDQTIPVLLRSLQANAHETFMDCPYYEQLNYVGDTLIDCLAVYTITRDVRLPRKSLQLFHDSRIPEGLTQSRFPSSIRQIIPPFSLLWVSLVRHHAWWRGEPDLIRSLLTGIRSVIDAHLFHVDPDGLLRGLRGWNFLDWVTEWKDGIPPSGDVGEACSPHNWLFVYALQAASEIEGYVGEPELAARYARLARTQARATEAAFWDEPRGLFADDPAHQSFSEHAQCLAVLSTHVAEPLAARIRKNLVQDRHLRRCTIYFSHYLFETFAKLGQIGPFFSRLEYWHGLPAEGFVTTPEQPEPSRSDCHAWGCHPLFHVYATILGIRPARLGFEEVAMRPQLGPLQSASGRMVHPRGWIEADLHRQGDRLEGRITLPEGVAGTFYGHTGTQTLAPGMQHVSI